MATHLILLLQASAAFVTLLLLEWSLRRLREMPAARTTIRALQAGAIALWIASAIDRLTAVEVWSTLDLGRQALNLRLFDLAGTPVTPMTVVTVLGVMVGSWWGSAAAGRTVQKVMARRGIGDEGTGAAVSRLIQYALMAVGVAVGLSTLGLNLSALFAASAVFAVGIGLAMQQVVENFVSGVILLVEQSIRPGDILLHNGDIVRVQHLGIRATVGRTLDEEEVIIPNSKLVQNEVKNLRLSDSMLRVRVGVGVSYDSDLRQTMRALERAADTVTKPGTHPPVVLLRKFGDSSVEFQVSVWTDDPWGKAGVESAVSLAIWDALHEDGIVIAFPQLDLHLDAQVVGALGVA